MPVVMSSAPCRQDGCAAILSSLTRSCTSPLHHFECRRLGRMGGSSSAAAARSFSGGG